MSSCVRYNQFRLGRCTRPAFATRQLVSCFLLIAVITMVVCFDRLGPSDAAAIWCVRHVVSCCAGHGIAGIHKAATNQSRNFPPTKYSASQALVFCFISQGPQPDSIPLALAYPPFRVKVSVRVQQCAQTQEWIRDRGMSTCASRKSPPSVRTLAWLGLVMYWKEHERKRSWSICNNIQELARRV